MQNRLKVRSLYGFNHLRNLLEQTDIIFHLCLSAPSYQGMRWCVFISPLSTLLGKSQCLP